MRTLLITALAYAVILFSGCGGGNSDQIIYKNDFEHMYGWAAGANVVKYPGKSGSYVTLASELNPYSQSFKLKFKDITTKKIKKIRFKCSVLHENEANDVKLIISIGNESNPSVYWDGKSTKPEVKELKKWTDVTFEADVAAANLTAPTNEIACYVWNVGKGTVYADDFEIEFLP